VQRRAAQPQRRDHRNLALSELECERVLFGELRVAPALRAIELGDDARPVFQARLVDAVFVAVEREQPPVAAQADRFERVEHGVRRQAVVGPQMLLHPPFYGGS